MNPTQAPFHTGHASLFNRIYSLGSVPSSAANGDNVPDVEATHSPPSPALLAWLDRPHAPSMDWTQSQSSSDGPSKSESPPASDLPSFYQPRTSSADSQSTVLSGETCIPLRLPPGSPLQFVGAAEVEPQASISLGTDVSVQFDFNTDAGLQAMQNALQTIAVIPPGVVTETRLGSVRRVMLHAEDPVLVFTVMDTVVSALKRAMTVTVVPTTSEDADVAGLVRATSASLSLSLSGDSDVARLPIVSGKRRSAWAQ